MIMIVKMGTQSLIALGLGYAIIILVFLDLAAAMDDCFTD